MQIAGMGVQECAVLVTGELECWGDGIGYPADFKPPNGWVYIDLPWYSPPGATINLGDTVLH